jgi:catechol 2,3-dioxygenase-like lactoylglutathione lyase family enzyme
MKWRVRFSVALAGWVALSLPAAQAEPPQATLMAATLVSTDLQRAVQFYVKALGMVEGAKIENPMVIEAPLHFPGGGPDLLLVKARLENALATPPARGRIVVRTSDVRAAAAQIVASGYALEGAVRDDAIHHVMIAIVKDPDANTIELVQLSKGGDRP